MQTNLTTRTGAETTSSLWEVVLILLTQQIITESFEPRRLERKGLRMWKNVSWRSPCLSHWLCVGSCWSLAICLQSSSLVSESLVLVGISMMRFKRVSEIRNQPMRFHAHLWEILFARLSCVGWRSKLILWWIWSLAWVELEFTSGLMSLRSPLRAEVWILVDVWSLVAPTKRTEEEKKTEEEGR